MVSRKIKKVDDLGDNLDSLNTKLKVFRKWPISFPITCLFKFPLFLDESGWVYS